MDIDDAVTILREVVEQRNGWRDAYIDIGKSEADRLRYAIKLVLSEMCIYHSRVDETPSLYRYCLQIPP